MPSNDLPPSAAASPTGWASNISIVDTAAWLRTLRNVVVTTHVKPDGDAIGSTLAIARAINLFRNARAAEVWYFGPMPPFAPKVIGDTPVRLIDYTAHPGGEPDGIVIVDTGSWQQLEGPQAWLRERTSRAAVVDHHVQGDPDVAQRLHIDTTCAAACQIAAELCRAILGVPSVADLPLDIATPCYLGLATDTGWFRHSNVTPAVFTTAASLLGAGVDCAELYRIVEQTDRPARVRLLARALSSLELFDNDRFAIMRLTRRDFDECGAQQGDAGGFADYAQTIESVRVVAMLTESEPDAARNPVTKVSFRSKDADGGVDVNRVARTFGGGGHIRASGARVNADVTQTARLVLEALRAAEA